MSLNSNCKTRDIQLSHLLIDKRWNSLPPWSHVNWLPVYKDLDVLKELYSEQDIIESLTVLQNAASECWNLVKTYPSQLFFQISIHVVDSNPSPFLSSYLHEISAVSTPDTKYSVRARRTTWDIPAGTLRYRTNVRSIKEYFLSATCLIPNSTSVVCGTSGGQMCIVDVQSKEHDRQIEGHSREVKWIAVSKDGALIASCCTDKTIRLWSTKTCEPVCEPLIGHMDWVLCVAISDDCKYIASASYDKTVRIWNVQGGHPVGNPLVGHSDVVCCVSFSPNGKYIVSGSYDKSIRIWHIPFRDSVAISNSLLGHEDAVYSVSMSPDGRHIISASSDKTVRVWDFSSREQVGEPIKFGESVRHVSVSNDNKTVVSIDINGVARLWDIHSRQVVLKFNFGPGTIVSSDVSVNFQNNILAWGPSRTIITCNLDKHTTSPQPFIQCRKENVTAATSADHSTVALYAPSLEKIYVWRATPNIMTVTVKPISIRFKYNGFNLSKDGSLLLEIDGNWIHVWGLKGQSDCFGIPRSSSQTHCDQIRNIRKTNSSTHAWKRIVSSRIKLGKRKIKHASFDSSGKIIVSRSDGLFKRCALIKKIRNAKWQLLELDDWTKKKKHSIIPPWLAPFGAYTARKTSEEVEKIPKWVMDRKGKHIYDIDNKRIVATFSTNIVHHSWKEVDDSKKELVVVLEDGRVYFLDLLFT